MSDFLSFSEITIAIALIFIVLIQSKNAALNLSTMSSSMKEITKRGPEKVLQNTTIVLATLFILNSVALFLIADNSRQSNNLNFDNIKINNNSGNDLKVNTNSGAENK